MLKYVQPINWYAILVEFKLSKFKQNLNALKGNKDKLKHFKKQKVCSRLKKVLNCEVYFMSKSSNNNKTKLNFIQAISRYINILKNKAIFLLLWLVKMKIYLILITVVN